MVAMCGLVGVLMVVGEVQVVVLERSGERIVGVLGIASTDMCCAGSTGVAGLFVAGFSRFPIGG